VLVNPWLLKVVVLSLTDEEWVMGVECGGDVIVL
jgi:hypothetical protein